MAAGSDQIFGSSPETRQNTANQDATTGGETFSIASAVVTNTSQLIDNLNDTSFLQAAPNPQVNKDDTFTQAPAITGSIEHTAPLMAKNVNDSGLESMTASDGFRRDQISQNHQEGNVKKKKSRTTKKGAKLDTKSKLEKSRQSARECRARKKLRYQYLEDLVCNREKAVKKLREELSMFCEMSTKIENGTISQPDRNSLIEQTKEPGQTN